MGRFTTQFRSFTFNFSQLKVKKGISSQSELYTFKKLSSLKNAIVK